MRISDGSSDVCSSDLRDLVRPVQPEGARDLALARGRIGAGDEIEDLLSRRQAGLWFGFRHRTRDTASRGRRHPRNQYARPIRSEEHTSELQSLMRISYAVFCLKKKTRRHAETTRSNKTHVQH